MLFGKNEERANDAVLYKTKPNVFLGCKKAIFGVVLLVIIFIVSPRVIQFLGEMQVYMISYVKLPLTRYAAIAFFVVILIVILYIILQLIRWYSMEYILTNSRIIVKSGIISTKKNYMPYTTIQDINTSQSVFARLFNVGTVSLFSAYDNNQIKLENISDPSKVEEIIFSHMMGYRNFQPNPRNYISKDPQETRNQFVSRNDEDLFNQDEYYDEYEPITPIDHENQYQRREYEYYPEEFSFQSESPKKYEYESYDDGLDRRIGKNYTDGIHYEGNSNTFSNDMYGNDVNLPPNEKYDETPNPTSNEINYNENVDDYSQGSDDYYYDYEPKIHYDDNDAEIHQNESEQVDDTSETVIRRHFDKFKK